MTQQQFYPQAPAPQQQVPQPQYPGFPPQPQQAYPPAPGYGQPTPPPAVPQQPLATGTIDDFYNQPTTGGGPSISWQNKPEGTSYVGVVARDVVQGDISQQTNFQTKQPEFYRDGRPKFVMKVPLLVNPTQEFPEGEAAYFVRGQARDELVRAMNEAGVTGAPRGGDQIQVTLVQRKPNRQGLNPSNVVAIRYTPGSGHTAGPATDAPSPTPVAPSPVPAPQAQAPAPPPVQQQAPQPVQQLPQPSAPAAPQQAAQPAPPPGLTPEQQQLLAQLTNQQG